MKVDVGIPKDKYCEGPQMRTCKLLNYGPRYNHCNYKGDGRVLEKSGSWVLKHPDCPSLKEKE